MDVEDPMNKHNAPIVPDYGLPEPRPPRLRYGMASICIGLFVGVPTIALQFANIVPLPSSPFVLSLIGIILMVVYFGVFSLPLGLLFGIAGVTLKGPHWKGSVCGVIMNGIPLVMIAVRILIALLPKPA